MKLTKILGGALMLLSVYLFFTASKAGPATIDGSPVPTTGFLDWQHSKIVGWVASAASFWAGLWLWRR